MSDATSGYDEEIEVVIDVLSSLDLHEFVYVTLSLLNVPFGELVIDNSAVTASYALAKVPHYVTALKQREARRHERGLEVRRDLAFAETFRATDPETADRLRQEAIRGTDDQQVEWHFFTICAAQIRRLLTVAQLLVGMSLPEEYEAFLDSYQPLRNQFEHLDERLPGFEKGGRLVLDNSDNSRLRLGVQSDNTGKITVQRSGMDVTAEVNARGVERIEEITTVSYTQIRDACIAHLRREFSVRPEKIPIIESIQPLVRRLLEDDEGVLS